MLGKLFGQHYHNEAYETARDLKRSVLHDRLAAKGGDLIVLVARRGEELLGYVKLAWAKTYEPFLSAGIPAMQFNHWPDNFYPSSGDVAERTDPTEMNNLADSEDPAGHIADNNHIHDYSRWVRTYRVGVRLSGVGLRASRNYIHNAPHSGSAPNGAGGCSTP